MIHFCSVYKLVVCTAPTLPVEWRHEIHISYWLGAVDGSFLHAHTCSIIVNQSERQQRFVHRIRNKHHTRVAWGWLLIKSTLISHSQQVLFVQLSDVWPMKLMNREICIDFYLHQWPSVFDQKLTIESTCVLLRLLTTIVRPAELSQLQITWLQSMSGR